MRKLIFVFTLIFGLCFSTISSAEIAPNFTLPDREGNNYTLSDYIGSPIFLFYFEDNNLLSFLKHISEDYSEKEIIFWAITNFENDVDWNFTNIPLLIDIEENFICDYEINSKIAIIIIDSEGLIKYKSIDNLDELEVKSNLNQILGVTGVEGVTWGRIKSLYIH